MQSVGWGVLEESPLILTGEPSPPQRHQLSTRHTLLFRVKNVYSSLVDKKSPKVDQSRPNRRPKTAQGDPKSSRSLVFSPKCRMSGLYMKTQYETMFFMFRLDKKVGREGLFFYFVVLIFWTSCLACFFWSLVTIWGSFVTQTFQDCCDLFEVLLYMGAQGSPKASKGDQGFPKMPFW